MKKPLEAAWMGLKVEWVGVSGNQSKWMVLSRLIETQTWLLSAGRLNRETMLTPTPLSGRKQPLQTSPWTQTTQFLPIYPWSLLSFLSSPGAQSKWVYQLVSLYTSPLRGVLGTAPTFVSLSLNLLWFSHSESMRTSLPETETLGWETWCEPGSSHSLGWGVGEGLWQLRWPSWFLMVSHGYDTSLFPVSTPPTSLKVAFYIYIHRCRASG